MIFVDEVVIVAQSGDGGPGCESYEKRSELRVLRTGGDGGKGGDVIFRADSNVTTLYPFVLNRLFRAESGQQGSSNQKTGPGGKDLLVRVPCGTKIFNKQENLLIRELVNNGDEVTVCQGGKGGIGNSHKRGSVLPAGKCQTIELFLSLHLRADVLLLGMPNAGKSALLKHWTHSRAQVEAYPFSTRTPQLGSYEDEEYQQFTFCELPALIPGSSEGKGLGNHFLKHLETSSFFLLMLDPLKEGFNLRRDYEETMAEITAYNPRLAEREHFAVVSKIDDECFSRDAHKNQKLPVPVFYISTVTGEGSRELLDIVLTKIRGVRNNVRQY